MKEHSRPYCVLTTKIITTKWTDPTKGQTYKSTKWTDPTRVKLTCPQSGRIPPRSTRSTKRTDPTRVELTSPQSGRIPPRVKLISPQSGRTQPRSNLQVHKVDGPTNGQTYKFTKWTDPTRVTSPKSGRIPPRVNTVHKVDRPNQGQTCISPKSGRTQQGSNLYNSKKEDGPYQR